MLNKNTSGFTLAEVLITLVVIGIIAGLTIPSLIQDIQNKQYITAYKKAYSDISNALLSGISNKELSFCEGKYDGSCHHTNFNAMKSKFVVVKECIGLANRMPCWANGGNYWGVPESFTNNTYFVDNKGRSWADSDAEPWIIVDTNGLKGPNANGLDRFAFIPVGDKSYQYVSFNDTPSLIGTPVKIAVSKDYISPSPEMCPSGKCYYTSWLQQ